MKELLCPPHETLEGLLAATLSDEQQTIVTTHIEDCHACQSRLESLTGDQSLHSFSHDKRKPGSTEAPPSWLLSQLLKSSRQSQVSDEVLSFLKPALQVGDLGLLGTYRIKKILGRGGMGVVLLGFDTLLKRLVALKVLWPPPSDQSSRSRIFREAQAVASIHHDHVVGIYAVHNDPGEPPCLAMEYVPGKTLKAYIKQADVPVSQYLQWCAEIAHGLNAAHAVGLIHRDIKPTNILIDENTQKAKLTDFGLARAAEHQSDQTRQALLAGTPAYMSPEQIQHPELVDQRSDVYGLGATLYEAITGTPPHRGPVEELIRQVVDIDPISPRRLNLSIPVDVETICLKCLAKDPAQRYAGTAELAADLERFLDGKPILARPLSLPGRAIKAIKRRPLVSALTVLLLLSLLSGALVSLYYWRHAEQNLRIANDKIDAAFRTIDQFCLRVSGDRLLSEPGMLPLRQELIQIAIPELQKLSRDRPSDPQLYESWIKSTYVLAKLKYDVEGPAEALPLLQTVLPELHDKYRAQPDNDAIRRLLADVLMLEGICRENLLQFQQAESIWKEIEELLAHRQAPEDQLILSRLYVNWNKTWADRRDHQRSEKYARQAQAISRQLADEHPELNEGRYILATSTGNLAMSQVAMGETQHAEKSYLEAIQLWKEICKEEPRQMLPELEKLRTNINLIELYLLMKRYQDVARIVDVEVPTVDRLIRKYPQSLTLRRFHGTLHLDAGFAAHFNVNANANDAERHYALAVACLSDCHKEFPEEMRVFYELIRARLLQSFQWQDAGKLESSLNSWEESLSLMREYATAVPEAELEMKELRTTVLMSRAMVYEELGKTAQARDNILTVLHDDCIFPSLGQMALLLLEERSTGQDQTALLTRHYRKMMEECLAAEKRGPSVGCMYYLAANSAARSLPLIAQDALLTATEQTQLLEQFRSAALRWLQTAHGFGYFASATRCDALLKNPRFTALHQTPQWRTLMSEAK